MTSATGLFEGALEVARTSAPPKVIAVVVQKHRTGAFRFVMLLGGRFHKVWLQYAGPVVGRHSLEEGNL